jgi:hypothetical protein
MPASPAHTLLDALRGQDQGKLPPGLGYGARWRASLTASSCLEPCLGSVARAPIICHAPARSSTSGTSAAASTVRQGATPATPPPAALLRATAPISTNGDFPAPSIASFAAVAGHIGMRQLSKQASVSVIGDGCPAGTGSASQAAGRLLHRPARRHRPACPRYSGPPLRTCDLRTPCRPTSAARPSTRQPSLRARNHF